MAFSKYFLLFENPDLPNIATPAQPMGWIWGGASVISEVLTYNWSKWLIYGIFQKVGVIMILFYYFYF